jgi:glycine cleavage system transcriptional repressor
MASYALAAIGSDRPGIVSEVARALYEAGCNVEDSSMTLLRGNFAIMLVFSAPESTDAKQLEGVLEPVCAQLGLMSSVLEVDDRPTTPDPSLVLTVYGADRPGILAGMTEALASRNVNITDLNSRLVGTEDPVYALQLELELPAGLSSQELESAVGEVASGLGVDISITECDPEVL